MNDRGFGTRGSAARLWGIATLVAAVDVAVALDVNPETAAHFAVVLGLCAAMAVWSSVTLQQGAR